MYRVSPLSFGQARTTSFELLPILPVPAEFLEDAQPGDETPRWVAKAYVELTEPMDVATFQSVSAAKPGKSPTREAAFTTWIDREGNAGPLERLSGFQRRPEAAQDDVVQLTLIPEFHAVIDPEEAHLILKLIRQARVPASARLALEKAAKMTIQDFEMLKRRFKAETACSTTRQSPDLWNLPAASTVSANFIAKLKGENDNQAKQA